MAEIRGDINEVRRTFTSEHGIKGKVESLRQSPVYTHAIIRLDDNRRAWTRYAKPKDVLLQFYKGKRK